MTILTAKAVIEPQMDQFAPATVLTTFGELMELRDIVSGELQCHKELHKLTLAI